MLCALFSSSSLSLPSSLQSAVSSSQERGPHPPPRSASPGRLLSVHTGHGSGDLGRRSNPFLSCIRSACGLLRFSRRVQTEVVLSRLGSAAGENGSHREIT